MSMAIMGRKEGITRVFTDTSSVPVTVISVHPHYITQIKTAQTDGYTAVQVATEEKRAKLVTKPMAGHFAKANVKPTRKVFECRLDENHAFYAGAEIGKSFGINDIFVEGQFIDVVGTSKGKGFAGTVKRHNFKMQDATHGNSLSHRVPGSTGQNQTPGRVFKGKKMPGRMGNARTTIQNLKIVKIDEQRNVILVQGPVPGCRKGHVLLKPSIKKAQPKGDA